jgi:uncharacterized protein YcfJ
MKFAYALPIVFLLAAGCTTPKTMLKNPQTGQVASCGGSAMGSMVGGVIGYHIQKSNDSDCVADYTAQGFTKVPNGVESGSEASK